VLLRVEKAGKLGGGSYEVVDTKLAQETKGGTLLQLSLYADLLADIQGEPPKWSMSSLLRPSMLPQAYRVAAFAAYYRRVRRRLEEVAANGTEASLYPDPIAHCDICRWRQTLREQAPY